MTPQRKTLLSVAAMLFCANAVALAVMNHKSAEALWIGMPTVDIPPPFLDGREIEPPASMVRLDRSGAYLNGRPVNFTAMIENIGEAEFDRNSIECRSNGYGCAASPWTAQAFVSADTPVSLVTAAYQAVRAICNAEVIFFVDIETHHGAATGSGFPVMIAPFGDPALTWFGSIHPSNETLMRIRRGETLDQFGERTGCARVSPLRP